MRWPTVKVASIRAKRPHSLVGGPFGSELTTKDYVEEGIPVIRGSNLADDQPFRDEGFVFVTERKADLLRANNAFAGDLIFTQRGTLGQVGVIPLDSKYPRYLLSQSQMKLAVDEARAAARFVYYFFRCPETVQKVKNLALTSGVPHINLGILRDFDVPLPPLEAQKRIIDCLSAYDDLIANNQGRMKLLEEAARLLYQEWFVRLKFPGHEHTPIVNGVPQGWSRRELKDVAAVNAKTLSGSFDGEIEYVDISSVIPGEITGTAKYDFRDAPSRARRIVRHGDIIWSCVRPNRRSYAMIWTPADNLIVSTGFAVITPISVPSAFIYFSTTTDAYVKRLENLARGAAYPAVLSTDFEGSELLVPPPTLLQTFCNVTTPIFSQLHNLKLQNQKLRTARDLLLPRLMSGEIAV